MICFVTTAALHHQLRDGEAATAAAGGHTMPPRCECELMVFSKFMSVAVYSILNECEIAYYWIVGYQYLYVYAWMLYVRATAEQKQQQKNEKRQWKRLLLLLTGLLLREKKDQKLNKLAMPIYLPKFLSLLFHYWARHMPAIAIDFEVGYIHHRIRIYFRIIYRYNRWKGCLMPALPYTVSSGVSSTHTHTLRNMSTFMVK